MKIDLNEVLRYLSAGQGDTEILEKAKKIRDEILPQLNPKKITARFEVRETPDGFLLDGTGVMFKGGLIKKTLSDANGIFLFAATLTADSERLLKNYSAKDYLSGVICDAVMTAAIESFCDEIENEISLDTKNRGQFAKPRISCGYGDFDLSSQQDILKLLNAEKILGIRLNESFMMYPNKTVTAIIAVTEAEQKREKRCENCDCCCGFRRNG